MCKRTENKLIQNAIAMKNKDQQVIELVPEALASKLFTLMLEWKIYLGDIAFPNKLSIERL